MATRLVYMTFPERDADKPSSVMAGLDPAGDLLTGQTGGNWMAGSGGRP